ncbi:MAG: hypothetical protein ACREC1_02050 [Methylovirgula sp.]
MNYTVSVGYDIAGSYYVYWSDILGLDVEAKSFDALADVVTDIAPQLLHDRNAKVTIEPGPVICDRVKARTATR